MSKKQLYLTILFSVTAVCIMGSIIYRNIDSIKQAFSRSKIETMEEDTSDNKKYFEEELSEFSSIKVDSDIMTVHIKQGSSYGLNCTYSKSILKPVISLQNGQLFVTQNLPVNYLPANLKCTLEITVPRFSSLNQIEITTDIGEMNLEDMTVKKLETKSDVGAIRIKNVEFNSLDAHSDVGAINISLLDSVDNYSMDVESDVGAVNVASKKVKHNSFSQNSGSGKSITVSTNVGAININ